MEFLAMSLNLINLTADIHSRNFSDAGAVSWNLVNSINEIEVGNGVTHDFSKVNFRKCWSIYVAE